MIGKRTIAVAMVGCLLLSIFMMMGHAMAASNNNPPMSYSWYDRQVNVKRDLIAGQHIDIGYVEIWNEQK